MKIKHFCNSFISVKCGNTTIVCDPWVGKADGIAWYSYPYNENGHELVKRENPDYIYISHLHSDHYDPKILRLLDKNIPIIIKHYENQHLCKRLKSLGFKNIMEISPWTVFELNEDIEIAIVTASNFVNDDITSEIEYDLDTSIHIKDKTTNIIFFNNVDTPNNIEDLKKNKNFAIEHWEKSADIACFPVGAASHYPQNYINLDREKSKSELVDRSLNELPERLNAIGTSAFFVAGGTYVIPGKYSPLNKWIAQPPFDHIEESLQNWIRTGRSAHNIEGGGSLELNEETSQWEMSLNPLPDLQNYINELQHVSYDYDNQISQSKVDTELIISEIDKLFSSAKTNYYEALKRNNIKQTWSMTFKLYRDLRVDKNAKMIPDTPLAEYSLEPQEEESSLNQIIHLDADLFYDTLTKREFLGVGLMGTFTLIERRPNKFTPVADYSLNYLQP